MKPAKLTKINTTGGLKDTDPTYDINQTVKAVTRAEKHAEGHNYDAKPELNGDE